MADNKKKQSLVPSIIALAIFIVIVVFLIIAFPYLSEKSSPAESTAATTTESITTIEEQNEPLSFNAEELYNKGADYVDQWVVVSGKVTYISDYTDMKGYYLYGTKGEGLVCWVDETSLSANVGDEVTFYGHVQSIGINQVELNYCKLITEGDEIIQPEIEEKPDVKTEVTSGQEMILMQIAEDVAAKIAQNPYTVKFSTLEWGFAREDYTFAVQGTFSCSNALGVTEKHVLQVWCEANEDLSKIQPYKVILDDVVIKDNEEGI